MSIEDPFDQDDWVHYAKMTEECGVEVQIVGDDLLVTNPTVSDLLCRVGGHFHFVGPLQLLISFCCAESCKGNQGEVMQCSSAEGIILFKQKLLLILLLWSS